LYCSLALEELASFTQGPPQIASQFFLEYWNLLAKLKGPFFSSDHWGGPF
jgi:hypothetical protein